MGCKKIRTGLEWLNEALRCWPELRKFKPSLGLPKNVNEWRYCYRCEIYYLHLDLNRCPICHTSLRRGSRLKIVKAVDPSRYGLEAD